jgi:hypothetical protein
MDQLLGRGYIISSWALMLAISVLWGLIIAELTLFLFGLNAFHLPGGSLTAGCSAGYTWQLKPTWLRFMLCTLAGLVGWSLLFITYH